MAMFVLILSGGMDSATLAYLHRSRGDECLCVSFDYGQRHRRELEAAKALAKGLGWRHEVVTLGGLTALLPGSSLTDRNVDTPHGHYQAPNMRKTVVPGRNGVMLAIAWGIAEAHGYDGVSTGVHAGDHAIYADCRPEFIRALRHALTLGTAPLLEAGEEEQGHRDMALYAPFLDLTKTDIARLGGRLGVPYGLTWTCYEGGEKHCGRCGACQERREAFRDAGLADPTEYLADA